MRRGTLDVISSDHSGFGYRLGGGRRLHGDNAPFSDIPNGVARSGLPPADRVQRGWRRGASIVEFVRLTASNPARLFGLYPRKGTIAPGSDADVVVWDATRRVTITNAVLQHVIDYTPFRGWR